MDEPADAAARAHGAEVALVSIVVDSIAAAPRAEHVLQQRNPSRDLSSAIMIYCN